ncbi:hypothetical protein BH09BAC4_BH09BAC4_34380 [soil metagenome]
MKKYYAFLALFLLAQFSLAQATFEYDAAGNRVKRNVTVAPDLSPIMYVLPSIIYGTQPLSVVIKVFEIVPVPTPGVVTVYLTKNTSTITLNLNPSTTFVNGIPVQNGQWTMDATSNPNYYILTTTTPIAALSSLNIGLTGNFIAIGQGTTSFSVTVFPLAGELNLSNNTASSKLNYFAY